LALFSSIRKIEEKREELKLNRTFQLFISIDDVNLLGGNINNMKRNTGTE
jgi:hypothetical protein